jgi:hypothetical protein
MAPNNGSRVSRGVAALLIVIPMALMLAAAAQQPRKIVQNDTPLPDRLLATDQTVVVERRPDEVGVVYGPHPPFKDTVRGATFRSQAVLLGVIENTDVRLTEHDTWIGTYSSLRVLEVLKAPKSSPFGPGGLVEIYEDGGEMTIKGVRVLAATEARRPFEPGRRYLVFTALTFQNRYEVPLATYEILPDGKLAVMLIAKPRTDWRQVLSGRSLDDVLRLIRDFPEWLKRHDPDRDH